MPEPIHRFLKDFSLRELATLPAVGGSADSFAEVHVSAGEQQEAYRRGYEEARAKYEDIAAQEKVQCESEAEAKIAHVTEALAGAALEALLNVLELELESMRHRIARDAACALQPFLHQIISEQAVTELAQIVAAILEEKNLVTLKIKGPASLTQLFNNKLSEMKDTERKHPLPCNVVTEIAEQIELQIDADGALIETRVEKWVRHVEETCRR